MNHENEHTITHYIAQLWAFVEVGQLHSIPIFSNSPNSASPFQCEHTVSSAIPYTRGYAESGPTLSKESLVYRILACIPFTI